MAVRRRLSTLLAVLVTVLSFSFLVGPSPAFADRCQPEELDTPATDPQPGIIPEDSNPVCLVMDEVTYPLLGCPAPTTLMGCQQAVITRFAANPVAASQALAANLANTPQYVQNVVTKAPATAQNLVYFGISQGQPYVIFVVDQTSGVICGVKPSPCFVIQVVRDSCQNVKDGGCF